MYIRFLGTGSAFTGQNYQTNTIISRNGKNLLIDAGGDIRFSLAKCGMSYKDIDAVYITHLHADHTGGLECLGFCSYFDPTVKDKIAMIGNNDLIRELWNHTLRGGLKSIQGQKTTLMDFFDITTVRKNGKFVWEDVEFQIVQSVHIMDGFSIVPSYGLMFVDPDSEKRIYYTGDTQFNPNQIRDFYNMADVIIHDCETTPFCSGVHANFTELETLTSDIKKKMLLHHYQDNVLEGRGTFSVDLATLLEVASGHEMFEGIEGILGSTATSNCPVVDLRLQDDPISSEWLEKSEKAGFGGLSGLGGFVERGTLINVDDLDQ